LAKLVPGVNDLATLYPEVAKEADGWDPTTVTLKSNKKVLWRCEKGHNWIAIVSDRTPPKSTGCPICSNRQALEGFNDVASRYPALASEADGWDPRKVAFTSTKEKSWRCSKGHLWKDKVWLRVRYEHRSCPVCRNRIVLPGFNDLATIYPDLAAEADGWETSNVLPSSHKKFPWRCKQGHSWLAAVSHRTPPASSGCPFCLGREPIRGTSDLATLFPQLASQADGWDPSSVRPGSEKRVQWRCELGHTYVTSVKHRTPPTNSGCPVCSGQKVLPGFNDLASLIPAIAAEADGWDPSTVTVGSGKRMAWRCMLGHLFYATVHARTPPQSSKCPVCLGQKVLPGFNDLATLFPEVAAEADRWDPRTYTSKSGIRKRWRCALGHTWNTTIALRTPPHSRGCPECAETGYKPSKPAWFYLLERPGEQQLGITNKKEGRLYTHSRNGWQELEVVGPFPGDQVLALEKKLKKWLRKEVGLVPGTHENWFTASLEVQSLAELKARSGVETNLF